MDYFLFLSIYYINFTLSFSFLFSRVSDPDPDPQDPHVFALPGFGSA